MKYAQIDLDTGAVVSVSNLSGEVEADHMIPLSDTDDVQPGDIRNEDGTWTRPDPPPMPEPGPDRISQLEAELADAKTQLALAKDLAAETSDTQQQLIELLIDMGVI